MGKCLNPTILSKAKSLSVEADMTLLISVSCKHAADEVHISFAAARRFGNLAKAYTNFRQLRCHPFD